MKIFQYQKKKASVRDEPTKSQQKNNNKQSLAHTFETLKRLY
jgi:hypothetical protein